MSTAIAEIETKRQSRDIDALIQQLMEEPASRKELAALLIEDRQNATPRKMSYKEFLEWADEDTLAEWVNGEVIMSSPASLKHQDIADFLISIIRMFVDSRDLGTVLSAPFQMKMEHGREPDILFISKDRLNRLNDTYLSGPADLVVEIISPESIGRDRGDKFYEYERGGVPEYWLIDPLTQRVELYQLDRTTRQYRSTPTDGNGRYHSAVLPGFWMLIDWLWKTPLPHPLQALGEITGIDQQEISRFMALLKGE